MAAPGLAATAPPPGLVRAQPPRGLPLHQTMPRTPEQAGQIKIFIPQLPKTVTLAMMREHFDQFGQGVDECVLKEKQGHTSHNFGFVWAVNEATASIILSITHVICGEQIPAPELARGRGPPRVAPEAVERLAYDPTAALPGKLFVGGLAQATTDVSLRTYFEAFGTVSEVLLPYDRVTHRSRGFGFVTFQESASLQRVMALGQFHMLDGNRVQVKPAVSKERMALSSHSPIAPPQGQYPPPPMSQVQSSVAVAAPQFFGAISAAGFTATKGMPAVTQALANANAAFLSSPTTTPATAPLTTNMEDQLAALQLHQQLQQQAQTNQMQQQQQQLQQLQQQLQQQQHHDQAYNSQHAQLQSILDAAQTILNQNPSPHAQPIQPPPASVRLPQPQPTSGLLQPQPHSQAARNPAAASLLHQQPGFAPASATGVAPSVSMPLATSVALTGLPTPDPWGGAVPRVANDSLAMPRASADPLAIDGNDNYATTPWLW